MLAFYIEEYHQIINRPACRKTSNQYVFFKKKNQYHVFKINNLNTKNFLEPGSDLRQKYSTFSIWIPITNYFHNSGNSFHLNLTLFVTSLLLMGTFAELHAALCCWPSFLPACTGVPVQEGCRKRWAGAQSATRDRDPAGTAEDSRSPTGGARRPFSTADSAAPAGPAGKQLLKWYIKWPKALNFPEFSMSFS